MSNEIEIIKIIGAVGGGGVAYAIIDRVLKFVRNTRNTNSHPSPCATLQVTQNTVNDLKDDTGKQWSKIDDMSKTLNDVRVDVSAVKADTQTLLKRSSRP